MSMDVWLGKKPGVPGPIPAEIRLAANLDLFTWVLLT